MLFKKKVMPLFFIKKKNKIFNKIFSEHIQVYNILFVDSDCFDGNNEKMKNNAIDYNNKKA